MSTISFLFQILCIFCCWWPVYFEFERDKDADGYDDYTGERRGG